MKTNWEKYLYIYLRVKILYLHINDKKISTIVENWAKDTNREFIYFLSLPSSLMHIHIKAINQEIMLFNEIMKISNIKI